MKHKILPTYLQGNYKESLREFGSTLYGVFGAEGLGGTPVAKSHFPEMNVKWVKNLFFSANFTLTSENKSLTIGLPL